MNWIKALFSEGPLVSAMRFIAVSIVYAAIAISFAATWAEVVLKEDMTRPYAFALAVISAAITGKVIQKSKEVPSDGPPTAT